MLKINDYFSFTTIPVLSIALERIKDPSGLSRRPVTVSVCPDILYRTSFFLRSHTYMYIEAKSIFIKKYFKLGLAKDLHNSTCWSVYKTNEHNVPMLLTV